MTVNPDAIPASLKNVSQWIVYRMVKKADGPKYDKVPLHPTTGRPHDGQDPAIWMSLGRALDILASGGHDGIGFVLTGQDPFAGVDLDNCLDESGNVLPWAEPIVYCFQSYTEVTPSRRGLRVLIRGKLPAGSGHRANGLGDDGSGMVEVYDSKRFFTVTGWHVEGSPAEALDRQEELDAFSRARLAREPRGDGPSPTPAPNGVDDEDVLRMARKYWPGEKFIRLFDHGDITDYGGNWSQADMGLCNFLAFWSGGDATTVDRLFRRSALMRDKWDERRGETSYGAYTIGKVVDTIGALYHPGIETSEENGTAAGLAAEPRATIHARSDWEPPRFDESRPAEPFPLDVLPPELADFLSIAASCLTCPVDFLAVAALAIAGTAMGRSVAIKVKESWVETASLYAALVARPGATKSPALTMIARPLSRITDNLIREYRVELARATKDQPKPTLRRVAVGDSTCEALAPILADNPRGVAMIRDELTAWATGMNQYKSGGKGSDRQFFLSAWSGTPVTVDRKHQMDRGPIHIPYPFLSVVGALTPEMIGELSDARSRDDGFIDRILFTMPDPCRVRWNDDVVPPDLAQAWQNAIQILFDRPMRPGVDGRPRPLFVRFSPEAHESFAAWFNVHCEESEGLDFPHHLEGAWSKLRAYCARLALILDQLALAH
jgi:putative DNA primase/helicase